MKYKIFNSSDNNVAKFVFETDEEEAARPIAVEAVLYRYDSYKKRTVICCSTQCGCPVGCVFCGTGKFFVRNLTAEEIIEQVEVVLSTIDCDPLSIEKFQIMFMSMGEPFLNYGNLEAAILHLSGRYPNAQLLVSTSAPSYFTDKHFNEFVELSRNISKVGIQFSIHESNDIARKKLIQSPTTSLRDIGVLGEKWAKETGRRPFFNYCVHERNNTYDDVKRLAETLDPDVWECTLSVICEKDNTVKNAIEQKLYLINEFSERMKAAGYSIRVFNPAGQDDIGGGCGQLWYFQNWLKKQKKQEREDLPIKDPR
jgi:23S rRNA (adenine2503-C2)-methyltransferase